MEVIHRISVSGNVPAAKVFLNAGFDLKKGDNTFDVGENHPEWESILKCVKKYKLFDFQYKTNFTAAEIGKAEYFALSPQWHFGYPQPEDIYEYIDATYNPLSGCKVCGSGFEQKNSFRIKKEPIWSSKKNICQLNWVFDEYFVSTAIKINLEGKIDNLRFREVVQYKKETVFADIWQLVIERKVPLVLKDDASKTRCSTCGRVIYGMSHITRGFRPKPTVEIFGICKSEQYFGGDHNSFQEIIISRVAYDEFIKAGVKGIDYIPCG